MKEEIQYVSPHEALSKIKSGDRIFVQGSAQTPSFLLNELAKEAPNLSGVELVFITIQGDIEIAKPEYADSFHINCLFVSDSVRKAVNEGHADFVPVFLSDIPDLFRTGIMPIDVSLIQVSPPDKHGYCSLGVSVDIARAAVKQLTNDNCSGKSECADYFWRWNHTCQPYRFVRRVLRPFTRGRLLGEDHRRGNEGRAALSPELIEDGSTLQMGNRIATRCCPKVFDQPQESRRSH